MKFVLGYYALLQMDIERIRYLTVGYLRIRLEKVTINYYVYVGRLKSIIVIFNSAIYQLVYQQMKLHF